MKFNKILEVLGVPAVVDPLENPSLEAIEGQIKAVQNQIRTADPTQKIELSKQINMLRQQKQKLITANNLAASAAKLAATNKLMAANKAIANKAITNKTTTNTTVV